MCYTILYILKGKRRLKIILNPFLLISSCKPDLFTAYISWSASAFFIPSVCRNLYLPFSIIIFGISLRNIYTISQCLRKPTVPCLSFTASFYYYCLLTFIASPIRRWAVLKYSSKSSMPMKSLPVSTHATPVDPLPMKQSRTVPFSGQIPIKFFRSSTGFSVWWLLFFDGTEGILKHPFPTKTPFLYSAFLCPSVPQTTYSQSLRNLSGVGLLAPLSQTTIPL